MRTTEMQDHSAAQGLRPESELLLACAGQCVGTASAERITALVEAGINWPLLMRIGNRHKVLPLLCRSLETTCPHAVPPATLAKLRQRCQATAMRNLFLAGELRKLLQVFDRQGIRVIPFKGSVLAADAYGDLALRELNDIDLVVREEDLLPAKQLLLAQHYQEQPQADFEHECGFVSEEGSYLVDLHWGFVPPYFAFPLEPLRLWEEAGTVQLAGAPVATFRPEALLLLLCLHGAKHCWRQLKWICDLAGLIRRHPEMDWEQVTRWAALQGRTRVLSLGLLLTRDLLGTVLPDRVQRLALPDPAVHSLAAEVRKWLFPEIGGPEHQDNPSSLHCHAFLLTISERLRDRIRYADYVARSPTCRRAWRLLPLTALLSLVYSLLGRIGRAGKATLRFLKLSSSSG